jgi:hypothetical protein
VVDQVGAVPEERPVGQEEQHEVLVVQLAHTLVQPVVQCSVNNMNFQSRTQLINELRNRNVISVAFGIFTYSPHWESTRTRL